MPSIEIFEESESLVLSFCPQDPTVISKVIYLLNKNDYYNFSKTLRLRKADLITELQETEEDLYELKFRFAEKDDSYFKVSKKVLETDFNVFFSSDYTPNINDFVADNNISIFSYVVEFVTEDIYIGGEHENAIPLEVFHELVRKFPNTTEKKKYARARVYSLVKDYFDSEKDLQASYETYLGRKQPAKKATPHLRFSGYETKKFDELYEKLSYMLEHHDEYSEPQWQKEIVHILTLLFPRYIKAIREVPVKDSWRIKKRSVDYLLVDAGGFIDVVEIKKPEFHSLITQKRSGRDNFIPVRKLSDAIMQTEKYLFHFNRWGKAGEKELLKDHKSDLPNDIEIKIVNPQGMVIMGRSKDLSVEQKDDFEVIRRQYRNIVDIITYDDLLHRLKVISEQFKSLKEGA